MQDVSVLFADGELIRAKSFGASGTFVGEIVFNTAMSGYQEIATDPSYAGQFVCFAMPEIGIVGTNKNDNESPKVFAKGLIVRNYTEIPSNFRSEKSLGDLLKEQNALGITNIDTRHIVKKVRDNGSMMMIASTELHEKTELESILNKSPNIQEIDYIKEVSTKTPYTHTQGRWCAKTLSYTSPKLNKKIIAIDFGIKKNILNSLCDVGLEPIVVPYDYSYDEIISRYKSGEIKGVFLSNGPGDPIILTKIQENIKKLVEQNIPIFGICLGHQLLSNALGYKTYKLKFGQHGGNHPVKNTKTNAVEITAQNHNYSVPPQIEEIATITHINLFDNTIEGVEYKNKPIFSVQHHPEASPGPKESFYAFRQFERML